MSIYDPYNTSHSEISMRDEMINTLEGSFMEISKKLPILLRKMKRDINGNPIECACIDKVTDEQDRDVYCPIDQGDRYIWDEIWISGYRYFIDPNSTKATSEIELKQGAFNALKAVFYTRYPEVVTREDKIIEIILNAEGKPVLPYRRLRKWKINQATDYRLDHGRLEYWNLACVEEKYKFLNGKY
jgi:hypothetical protein